ncbi:MAG: hypothetical protein EOO04_13430 [Chitinophagaceae bacterium]|nr:MAG: hypothetical protein EOO04_13430 [Chitinophagaceae bacterium]
MKVAALKQYLQQRLVIILLVSYFVLHGVVINAGTVSLRSGINLLLLQLACSLFLYELCLRIYRTPSKAALASFVVITGILFFGVFQDMVAGFKPIADLGRLVVFFPLVLLVTGISLLYLYYTKKRFIRLHRYLTYLLIIYMLIDVVKGLRSTSFTSPVLVSGKPGYVGPRPDIYLVLLDEYLGHEGLQSYFNYPNSNFRNFLQTEGFYQVKRPVSNYSLTVYSIGSLLNMKLFEGIGDPVISNHYAYKTALEKIENNRVCSLFSGLGYAIRNKSPFYLSGQAPAYSQNLLPQRLDLLQHQTMYYRVAAALPDFLGAMGNDYFILRKRRRTGESNERMMQEVLEEANLKSGQPRFTYMHLMMPHDPFLRDSLGGETKNFRESEWTQSVKDDAYLQYLVYTNNTIAAFLRKLNRITKGDAVILLMSDHGSRHVASDKLQLGHNTINSVYVPGSDSASWYDGLSNVNAFPVLFKELFGLRLSLQRDSIVTPD